MKTFRIPLRVVFYKEAGSWIAHCLEFDLCGDGETKAAAVRALSECIGIQLEESLKHQNPRNLFTPASSEVYEKFFAGTGTSQGELHLEIEQKGSFVIEEPEYREYSEDSAGTEEGLVHA